MGSVISVEQRTCPWTVGSSPETETASSTVHESEENSSLPALRSDGRVVACHDRKFELVHRIRLFSRFNIG